jgi:hypothetical protein
VSPLKLARGSARGAASVGDFGRAKDVYGGPVQKGCRNESTSALMAGEHAASADAKRSDDGSGTILKSAANPIGDGRSA